VLFDINRGYESEIKPEKKKVLPTEKLNDPGFQSNLIIASNRTDRSGTGKDAPVILFKASRQSSEAPFILEQIENMPEILWPENAFALSHVCIPISPEDEHYGQNSEIGKIDLKKDMPAGEKNVLANDASEFDRIRFNPFYSVIKTRLEAIISEAEVVTMK
jgi:hypothetical protein